MRLSSRLIALSTLGLVLGTRHAPAGTPYGDILGKQVKAALGKDFKNYRPLSYPTNNFGILTIYAASSGNPDDRDHYCATWTCIGAKEVPSELRAFLAVQGFADTGKGPQVKFTDREKRELALSGILPKLFDLLGLSASYDRNKLTIVSFEMGPAYKRLLNRDKFYYWMDNLPDKSRLKQQFESGRLTVVVGDVVLTSMTADITLSSDLKSAVDAKLTGMKRVGDIAVGFKLNKDGSGVYHVEAEYPLVALRLVKKQSGKSALATRGWSDWDSTELPEALPSSAGVEGAAIQ